MFKNLFEKNNGCFCWVSVSKFNGGISERYKVDGLEKGDVLTGKISYPLDFGKSVEISLAWDENRFKLCESICKMYKKIYISDLFLNISWLFYSLSYEIIRTIDF